MTQAEADTEADKLQHIFRSNLIKRMDELNWQPAHLRVALFDAGHPVSEFSIKKWIAGDASPKSGHLLPIARVLGVSIGALFSEEAE